MEWVQFIIFFIGVFGLFIWNRAESSPTLQVRRVDKCKILIQNDLNFRPVCPNGATGRKFNSLWIKRLRLSTPHNL